MLKVFIITFLKTQLRNYHTYISYHPYAVLYDDHDFACAWTIFDSTHIEMAYSLHVSVRKKKCLIVDCVLETMCMWLTSAKFEKGGKAERLSDFIVLLHFDFCEPNLFQKNY